MGIQIEVDHSFKGVSMLDIGTEYESMSIAHAATRCECAALIEDRTLLHITCLPDTSHACLHSTRLPHTPYADFSPYLIIAMTVLHQTVSFRPRSCVLHYL